MPRGFGIIGRGGRRNRQRIDPVGADFTADNGMPPAQTAGAPLNTGLPSGLPSATFKLKAGRRALRTGRVDAVRTLLF